MTHLMRNPGSALPRATGAEQETDLRVNFHFQAYPTCSELQSIRLQRRCGLSRRQSRLVAALFFGEGCR